MPGDRTYSGKNTPRRTPRPRPGSPRLIATREVSRERHRFTQACRSTVIVVDTNVLAYLLLPCEFSLQADALYRKDPEWAAPILWRSEFRNLLAGYLRRKTLTFEQALKVQAEAEALLAGNEHEVDSRHVLELVRDSDCTAYDCEFVALAIKLGVKATTGDKKLLKAFPDSTAAFSAA